MDRLSRLCMEAVAIGRWPSQLVIDRAQARLKRESEARKRRLAKSRPRRRREVEKEVEDHVRQRAIWWAIMERAGGDCELCGKPAELMQAHHLLGGNGRRRQKEAVETVMAVCIACHQAFHARPWDYRHVVRAWAARHNYPVPNRKEYR